jgi:uncharacterized protein DUF5670
VKESQRQAVEIGVHYGGDGPTGRAAREELAMLYTFAVVLLVLWLLGLVSGYAIGSFIHVLLVIAIVLVLMQVISGRRVSL